MREALGNYDGTPESAVVVERFELPDQLPEPVAVAAGNFNRCVEGLRAARLARNLAEDELVAAIRADVEREAAAVVAGTAPPKQKAEDKARAVAEDARRKELVAESAADQAGDALLVAIEEARDEWLLSLDEKAAAAADQFKEAIAEAGSALDELSWALAPRAWLSHFNAARAQIGRRDGGIESLRYRPDLPEPVAAAFPALAALGAAAQATRETVSA